MIIHSCCRQQNMEVGGQETYIIRATHSSTYTNLANPPMYTVFSIKRRVAADILVIMAVKVIVS